MMKGKIRVHFKFVFLFFLFFSPFVSRLKAQQSVIDSLKNSLDDKLSDTVRIQTILNLAKEYSNTANYSFSTDYALQAKSAAEALISTRKELKRFGEKIIAGSYNCVGNNYAGKGDYEKALPEYQKSLEIRQQISDNLGIANSFNNIGNVYLFQGNYESALQNYLYSFKIMQELNNLEGMATSYGNIGNIYYYQNNLSKALENYKGAIELYRASGDKQGLAATYDNIGNIYSDQKNYGTALENILKSLTIRIEIDDKEGMANSYNNIGNIYLNRQDYDKALENHWKAVKIREEIGDKQGIANSYTNLGVISKDQNRLKEAENYFKNSLEISKKIGYAEGIKEAYKMLSSLYEKKNNYQDALQYRNLYYAIRDSLLNESTTTEIAEMNAKFESERKDLALTKKDAELTNQQSEARQQYLERNILIMGLILVLCLAIFIYYSYGQKKKVNENLETIIAQRTAELKQQNYQKELMLQEIHHRVKNNLQLISSLLRLQLNFKGDKNVDEILSNCADRIKSMAILHDRLYKENDYSGINTLDYFTELTEYVSRNHNGAMGRAQIELKVIPVTLPIGKLLPCGLVLNELISNAYKYAFTKDSIDSMINISFTKNEKENNYILSIADNGKGFPEKFDINQNSGLGLTIVQSLVEQLDGKISFERNERTIIDISFPS